MNLRNEQLNMLICHINLDFVKRRLQMMRYSLTRRTLLKSTLAASLVSMLPSGLLLAGDQINPDEPCRWLLIAREMSVEPMPC